MKPSSRACNSVPLSDFVTDRVNQYALGATANLQGSFFERFSGAALKAAVAGVGIFALTPPANAKIVYTPTDVWLSNVNPYFFIDINRDGVQDFYLKYEVAYASDTRAAIDEIDGLKGAAVQAYTTARHAFAYARRSGAKIGPEKNWFGEGDLLYRNGGPNGTQTRGRWWHKDKGVRNHYVALRFSVKGKNHYGWARLSTKRGSGFGIPVHLTGCAYETVPNKPIIAGHITESNMVRHSQAGLGQLALGVAGH
jgi:hypothetical protein